MKGPSTLALLAVLAVVSGARAGTYDRRAPIRRDIAWQTCVDATEVGYECGEYDVPLDYANPNAGKATIAVVRYASTMQPRLGSIFINPGALQKYI